MKKYIQLSYLLLTTLLIIGGCEDEKQMDKDSNSSVVINQIEKSITKEDTNLGCNGKTKDEECTEDEDATQFILNTLTKELQVEEEKSILSLKENLNRSLKEISKEEQTQIQLKDNLVAFVKSTNNNRAKELESFISKIETDRDSSNSKVSNPKRVAEIKDELNNLMQEEPTQKSKEIKERLEVLMSDITTSKRTLSQTKTTLQNLVDKVEKTGDKSDKKFANAIIEDVSTNKISILEEDENYFTITVQEGDNLSVLAKRYYSDTDKFKLIYEANRDKINEKYEIYPGSKLLIPKI